MWILQETLWRGMKSRMGCNVTLLISFVSESPQSAPCFNTFLDLSHVWYVLNRHHMTNISKQSYFSVCLWWAPNFNTFVKSFPLWLCHLCSSLLMSRVASCPFTLSNSTVKYARQRHCSARKTNVSIFQAVHAHSSKFCPTLTLTWYIFSSTLHLFTSFIDPPPLPSNMVGNLQIFNLCLHSTHGEYLVGEVNPQWDHTVTGLAMQVCWECYTRGEHKLHAPTIRLHLWR